jgi:BolA family transcriptional regulator, general stress-responsive regulator
MTKTCHRPPRAVTGPVGRRIAERLEGALEPIYLDVIDESHAHAGHMGARPSGETHFRALVVSGRFADLSRLDRQRLVYGLLAEELAGPVHALALALAAPGEPAALRLMDESPN